MCGQMKRVLRISHVAERGGSSHPVGHERGGSSHPVARERGGPHTLQPTSEGGASHLARVCPELHDVSHSTPLVRLIDSNPSLIHNLFYCVEGEEMEMRVRGWWVVGGGAAASGWSGDRASVLVRWWVPLRRTPNKCSRRRSGSLELDSTQPNCLHFFFYFIPSNGRREQTQVRFQQLFQVQEGKATKPVKKKGSYPLRPGVQGFFITCDGGRERQASHEAIDVIDSFFEELVIGKDPGMQVGGLHGKASNKKIKFTYSDSSSGETDDDEDGEEEEKKENKSATSTEGDKSNDKETSETLDHNKTDSDSPDNGKDGEPNDNKEVDESNGTDASEAEEPPAKKQCLETEVSKSAIPDKVEVKSMDKLIEAELKELGDKSKRRFFHLDTGCNGVVFVQMSKREGDPGPKDIVQNIMTTAAATKKHMSRFILRILPVELACYASEEEISRAIVPLVEKYFPVETETPQKFAVLYGARANTGVERMKIIDAVAKSVPKPHRVDLNNPDRAFVVEIVKTVCLIGVIEKYKELAKYNLRQLTSSKP
ncbi:hypothetical protein F8388_017672 [Cannabis sativa]|uniref:THUMP domain-containing protein n=1 Tax=Cannabis sativa TaxID=3483 RepID=A0A7J6HI64_CANSA|nr:hypothetical protein F8388_017672 [Cannabis sativa]